MACTLLYENPQPLIYFSGTLQVSSTILCVLDWMKLDTIEEKVALIMQKEKILTSVRQHLCCVVCSSLIVLDELHTLTCCGQHICASCLNALMGDPACCPYCRSRPVSTVALKDVKRVVSQVYSSDLPELQWYSILYDPRVHIALFIHSIDRQDRDLRDVKESSRGPKQWPVMIGILSQSLQSLYSLYQQSDPCCQLVSVYL